MDKLNELGIKRKLESHKFYFLAPTLVFITRLNKGKYMTAHVPVNRHENGQAAFCRKKTGI